MGDGPGEQESPRELVGFFTRMATSNLKNSSYQHAGNRRWVESKHGPAAEYCVGDLVTKDSK